METVHFMVLSIVFFIICIVYIFLHGQLKKANSILQTQLKQSNEKIRNYEFKMAGYREQINQLNWQIANPPKYKKGDKFGDLVIISHELYKPGLGDFLATGFSTLILSFIFHKDKQFMDSLKETFNKKTTTQYVYSLKNTITDKIITKRELELSSITSEKK